MTGGLTAYSFFYCDKNGCDMKVLVFWEDHSGQCPKWTDPWNHGGQTENVATVPGRNRNDLQERRRRGKGH